MTITASDQLPLPFDGCTIEPTPAMRADEQHVHQCAWCGTVVIVPVSIDGTRRPIKGKACPACGQVDYGWWKAEIRGDGIAGFLLVEP